MAATADDTDIGHLTLFKKKTAPTTYTTLAEVVEFNPPEMTKDAVEFTHMSSPERWREFKPGLKDGGDTTLTYNLIPGEADDDTIADSFASDVVEEWQVAFPNGATLDIKGFFTAHSRATPLEDRMTGAATFKVSGKPVLTAAV
ncbi:phage tail protein [Sphingomonas histidinilytica]|uniref:phage tail tube protein n=1 Tax=Rhizorhabdus histidinilytica TaxID=439228 RepID=UPI001ADCFBDE|nr:phage tail tube protein [Rhizorhabdus histidinilytica]MBO9377674.1 phage tail protein [Rhizorhabdus histidinilytica]